MCERMAQTNTCGTLRTGCVAASIMFRATGSMPSTTTIEAIPGPPAPISLDARIRDLETGVISWALRVSDGNKSRAAELLQVKRSTLTDRIQRYQLDRGEAPHAIPADVPPPHDRIEMVALRRDQPGHVLAARAPDPYVRR